MSGPVKSTLNGRYLNRNFNEVRKQTMNISGGKSRQRDKHMQNL